jgi:rod shape determining protein RodA
MTNNKPLLERLDWGLIFLFILISLIGVYAIFSVEYKGADAVVSTVTKSYNKQLMWLGISLVVGFVIIMLDSKIYVSIPFVSYLLGIFLLLLVLFVHENVRGSKSFLPLGFLRFQPGELAKVFTALALSKFLSLQETDFRHNTQHRLIAIGIVIVPSILVILSSETGLALVYFSFFLAMYREGLPRIILVIGFSIMLLTIVTLVLSKKSMLIFLLIALIIVAYLLRKILRRSREILIIMIATFLLCIAFSQILVPYAFKKVLKGYQVDRIYTMIGQSVPKEYLHTDENGTQQKAGSSQYNVKQSIIAIGSGGFFGKGPLNGTQTQGNFVPEQSTDFIFCSIGEQFGFLGCMVLIALYVLLLLRIVSIAENQRSLFTRIYAYCLAGIILFHLAINVSMTIGLAPVIGIPLPMLSYGGTSLLTFSILFFILVRLDADKNIALR